VPAPAVIPTPQAYTNVAVVKTFVVNISALLHGSGQDTSVLGGFPRNRGTTLHGVVRPGLFGEQMPPSGGIVARAGGCAPQCKCQSTRVLIRGVCVRLIKRFIVSPTKRAVMPSHGISLRNAKLIPVRKIACYQTPRGNLEVWRAMCLAETKIDARTEQL
jgi:hypothetical protein